MPTMTIIIAMIISIITCVLQRRSNSLHSELSLKRKNIIVEVILSISFLYSIISILKHQVESFPPFYSLECFSVFLSHHRQNGRDQNSNGSEIQDEEVEEDGNESRGESLLNCLDWMRIGKNLKNTEEIKETGNKQFSWNWEDLFKRNKRNKKL